MADEDFGAHPYRRPALIIGQPDFQLFAFADEDAWTPHERFDQDAFKFPRRNFHSFAPDDIDKPADIPWRRREHPACRSLPISSVQRANVRHKLPKVSSAFGGRVPSFLLKGVLIQPVGSGRPPDACRLVEMHSRLHVSGTCLHECAFHSGMVMSAASIKPHFVIIFDFVKCSPYRPSALPIQCDTSDDGLQTPLQAQRDWNSRQRRLHI